ncbi:MAG: trypsin-like peptidase domain-containing protein [Actinomycetota bacterium]
MVGAQDGHDPEATTQVGGAPTAPGGIGAPPSPPAEQHRSPMLMMGAAALAVSLIALVAAIVVTRGGDDGDDVEAGPTTETVDVDDEANLGAEVEPTTAIDAEPAEDTTPETAAGGTAPKDDDTAATPDAPASEAEALASSVVQIQLLLDGATVCTGSGTIVDSDGTILTNFHVIEQSTICPHDTIGIALADSSQQAPEVRYQADLLAADPVLDLAVVRIARDADGRPNDESFTPIPLGNSDTVALGDDIRVIGYPAIGGETVTFTEGSVSGFTTDQGRTVLLKTDATIAGGNSGGLAADADGTIIGVPTRAGTGEGRIVDCRTVSDTNGDGRIDQGDSCVPIGGFINGIKPIALAADLLAQARATTAPIDQGEPPVSASMGPTRPIAFAPQWTLGVTADGVAAEPVLAAPAGAGELCLTWAYEGIPIGSAFEAQWFYNGVFDAPPSSSGTTSVDGSGTFFACINNPNGLADGLYELVWVIEGEPIFAEATFVGGDRAALTVEVLNESGADLCVVQFNAVGAQTFGLNHIDAPVPAGGSVTVPLVVAEHVARVIDCDGVVRFEDTAGTLLDGNMTLTVVGS